MIARRGVREPAYMHSFGLSERWIVLAEFPYVVNPLRLAFSGRPYIENYRWKPELGTRFTLIDRATGEAVGPFETDPFFGFHHVNAYEDGDEVVVDICVFEDAADRRGPLPRAAACRQAGRRARAAPLPDPARRRCRSPMSAWSRTASTCRGSTTAAATSVPTATSGASASTTAAGSAGSSRPTSRRRETKSWSEPGCFAGEPVFVAAPDAEGEDEGVLLSVVLDSERGGSFLLVLDAQTLEELARAEAPHHIPFGFHGQFAPSG